MLNDTSRGCHFGCFCTSEQIKRRILEHKPESLVCLTAWTSSYDAKDVPVRAADFGTSIKKFMRGNPVLAGEIEKCDAVIINGEGTIHDFSDPAPRALLYIMYLAKTLGKTVLVINHSCFPNSDDAEVLKFYRAGYNACDYIAARDSDSVENIRRLIGDTPRLHLSMDSTPLYMADFTLPEKRDYVCISGGVKFDRSKIPVISDALENAFPGLEIVFLTGAKIADYDDRDRDICAEFQKYNPRVRLAYAKDAREWIDTIAAAKAMVSGRYHYAVVAMASGTPVVCFNSNTDKISSLRKMFGLDGAIIFDAPDFTESLAKALNSPPLRLRTSRGACGTWRRKTMPGTVLP
jgi:polysaccharide pyruvyl transferase WcaK-like protein